jgi:DNA-binding NarL/FixJ family response regulator
MKPIRILLAEDHTIVRKGIRAMLELDPCLIVLGEAKDGRQAINLAVTHQPDVILMDIAMPKLNGLEATRQLLKILPRTKVIILSAYDDDNYVSKAIDSGAVGYMLKQSSLDDLCRAIRSVMQGKIFFSHKIAVRLQQLNMEKNTTMKTLITHAAPLTARESELLQLIAEGNANKQIASVLSISVKTVEKHRTSLMKKLNIHDIASLTRYAISEGVVESCSQQSHTHLGSRDTK